LWVVVLSVMAWAAVQAVVAFPVAAWVVVLWLAAWSVGALWMVVNSRRATVRHPPS
jgi:hypothetical protein